VSFVYDEFYDYISALAHIREQKWDDKHAGSVSWDFGQLLARSGTFEQLRGVAEYLVLICERRGLHRGLCAVLARTGHIELLCNVLPKLKDSTDWMADALKHCLQAIQREDGRPDIDWHRLRNTEGEQEVLALLMGQPDGRMEDGDGK